MIRAGMTNELGLGCSMIVLVITSMTCNSLVSSSEASSALGPSKFISGFTLDDLTDPSIGPSSFNHLHATGSSHQNPMGPLQRLQLLEQTIANHNINNNNVNQNNNNNNNNNNGKMANIKRSPGDPTDRKTCHPTKPFLCPSDDPLTGECIPIQYLCDGSSDCPPYGNSAGGYDEDPLLCTAAKRPPVEETANFLRTLIVNHGPQYIEKLFGEKMARALTPLGGPERVAIALSVSKTIEDFGKALHLMRMDIDHLRSVLVAVQTMDSTMLKNLGIVRNSELADMKFFLEKLLSTGFLD